MHYGVILYNVQSALILVLFSFYKLYSQKKNYQS